ncbi:MFS transporter [Rhodobacterales bacterium]|nr:MFS transporter [Rhodobacterales bacterium]
MTYATDAPAIGAGRRRAALAALYLAAFMNILDVTVVNLALPSIRADFGASDAELEWVLVVYVLTFAAGLLPFGRFGDIIGRKRMFIFGVSGFTLSSLCCGLAPDILMLIASRAVQGLSGAMMVPQVLAIVQVMVPAPDRGKAIGLFGSVNAFGAVAGPLVGGVIVSLDIAGLSWRPIFLLNLPLGLLSLWGALRFLPKVRADERLCADWTGTILFALTIFTFLFPLVEGHQLGWPAWCFVMMAGAAGLALLFVRVELHKAEKGRAQVLPVLLLKDPVFAGGLLFVGLFFSCLAGLFFVLALFLQSGLGFTPFDAGLAFAAHPLGVMVASWLTGRFGDRWLRGRVLAGVFLIVLGVSALRLVLQGSAMNLTVVTFLLPLLAIGIGTGTAIAALFQTILSRVSGPDSGAGSGVMQAFQQIGIALGLALQGQIFFAALGQGTSPEEYLAAFQTVLLCPFWIFGLLLLSALGLRFLRVKAGDG